MTSKQRAYLRGLANTMEPILHVGKFSRGERALFKPAPYRPSAETPDSAYPMIFTTGRILYHYHTSTMTGRVEGLKNISGRSYVEINPADAAKLGIVSGDSDYVPLVGKLKSMGKFVLGISRSEAASNIFINACNEFQFLEGVSRKADVLVADATTFSGFEITKSKVLAQTASENTSCSLRTADTV